MTLEKATKDMKVQLKDIVLAVPALSKLSAGDLQLHLAYRLKRMISALQKEADFFAKVLPCADEMRIAVLYWNAICCMRGNLTDHLLAGYRDDMKVGGHSAYQSAVAVFLGKTDADEAIHRAEHGQSDLNAVVSLYGIAVYLAHCGKTESAHAVMQSLLRRESVWPCISYLAAWNDLKTDAV